MNFGGGTQAFNLQQLLKCELFFNRLANLISVPEGLMVSSQTLLNSQVDANLLAPGSVTSLAYDIQACSRPPFNLLQYGYGQKVPFQIQSS